jgi:hypothetical protein
MQNDDFTFKGVAPYGMRHGTITPKGKGYFGELKRPDGDSSTELSSEFEYKGGKVEYPLIVPTLSEAEINHLLSGKAPTDDILDKAESWAKSRIDKGMSPFASSMGNEKFPKPESFSQYDNRMIDASLLPLGATGLLDEKKRKEILSLLE